MKPILTPEQIARFVVKVEPPIKRKTGFNRLIYKRNYRQKNIAAGKRCDGKPRKNIARNAPFSRYHPKYRHWYHVNVTKPKRLAERVERMKNGK